MCKGENHGKPMEIHGNSHDFHGKILWFPVKMFPTKKNPSIDQLRDSLGGCHQRHRYLAARRSFGPQTGLMAVLRCGACDIRFPFFLSAECYRDWMDLNESYFYDPTLFDVS